MEGFDAANGEQFEYEVDPMMFAMSNDKIGASTVDMSYQPATQESHPEASQGNTNGSFTNSDDIFYASESVPKKEEISEEDEERRDYFGPDSTNRDEDKQRWQHLRNRKRVMNNSTEITDQTSEFECLKQCIKSENAELGFISDDCDSEVSYSSTEWLPDDDSAQKNTLKQSKRPRLYYPCDECEFVVSNKKILYNHKKEMHERVKYPCDECEYSALSHKKLERHKKQKHGSFLTSISGLHLCDLCGYVGKKLSKLRQHQQDKHEGVRHLCDLCDYHAGSKTTLRKHKKVIHENYRVFCDQCDYSATNTWNLKSHKDVKHNDLRIPCDMCEYRATTRPNLKKHKEAKHLGIKYPCEKCSYAATQKQSLEVHMRNMHADPTGTIADEIGDRDAEPRSTTNSNSKTHAKKSLSQASQVMISCDQCDYHTPFKGNLKKHKEAKHDGIKYPCDKCDYAATQKQSLMVHMRKMHI